MKIDLSANIKEMTAIPTEYKNYWFRSRLEARWAVFFDEMEVRWTYEVQGFRLKDEEGNSINYLPDFYLKDIDNPWEDPIATWVEVKGVMKNKDKVKCRQLAIESEHPVLLVQGDPFDEEITLYRKHTPVQKVKLAATAKGMKIVKVRTSNPTERLKKAKRKARMERFEN